MDTSNHTLTLTPAPEHSGVIYESIIHDIIRANPLVAAKALKIAREGGDVDAAIQAQLQNWGADGQVVQIQRALVTLVEYYQAVQS